MELIRNIFFWIILFILIIVIVVFIIDKVIKFWPTLKESAEVMLKYMYLFLIPFPLCYLIFYYYVYDAGQNTSMQFAGAETAEYLEKISIYFFSAGIFSATFKLINSLVVFQNHFKNIIISKEFDQVLTDKLEVLALSDDYLLKRADLNDIWARVSVCKYEQKFPQLKDAIREKLENDLFHENNLSYYYENFRTQINYELISENVVKIVEISNFTLISNSIDPIIMDFWISTDDVDGIMEVDKIYTKYIAEKCKIDGVQLNIKEVNNNMSTEVKYFKTFNAELKGKKEYEVERSIEMTQNLEVDRVFSFSSNRIIDNLSVKLNSCDKLNIYFSPVGKNMFKIDNQIHEGQSYISRELLLSGEKFQTFIYKKS